MSTSIFLANVLWWISVAVGIGIIIWRVVRGILEAGFTLNCIPEILHQLFFYDYLAYDPLSMEHDAPRRPYTRFSLRYVVPILVFLVAIPHGLTSLKVAELRFEQNIASKEAAYRATDWPEKIALDYKQIFNVHRADVTLPMCQAAFAAGGGAFVAEVGARECGCTVNSLCMNFIPQLSCAEVGHVLETLPPKTKFPISNEQLARCISLH